MANTKFLRDGAPFDPRAARQQAQALAKKAKPQHNPLPVKDKIPPPGVNRRAPAEADAAYARIMEQRARQQAFSQAGSKQFIQQDDVVQVGVRGNSARPVMEHPQAQQPVQAQQLVQPVVAKQAEHREGFVLDERYQEVFLPSKFLPYSFKRLYVRQLTRGEIKAVVRAKASGSHRHLVNALGQTISVDVYDLTVGDFWYLMYWHRINSYKRTPFNVTWTCTEEQHVARTQSEMQGEAEFMAPSTLENQMVISNSNLKEIAVDPVKYTEVAQQLLAEYGIRATPQLVRDFVDILETEEEDQLRQQAKQQKLGKVDVENDDELMNLLYQLQEEVATIEVRMYGYRYAAIVSREHGETLEDRDAFLDTLDPEVDQMLEQFLQVSDHGVKETFKVTCAGCGASKEIKSSLDALSFLPAYIAGDAS